MCRLVLRLAAIVLAVTMVSHPVYARQTANSNSPLAFRSVSLDPIGRAIPGGAIVLKGAVVNTGTSEATGTLIAKITGVENWENATLATVPPGELQQVEVVVELPPDLRPGEYIEIQVSLMIAIDGREVRLVNAGIPVQHSLRVPIAEPVNAVLLVSDEEPAEQPEWMWPPRKPHASRELIAAGLVDAGQTPDFALADGRLPLRLAEWNSYSSLVVADPQIFRDAAAVDAMRLFLATGGKMWVMLDRVPSQLVADLLAPGQAIETVDTIELNEFQLEATRSNVSLSAAERTEKSWQPLEFTRVLQVGAEVSLTIDGWPAAMRMPVGRGQLFLSTLPAEAWIQKRIEQPRPELRFQTGFTAKRWGSQFVMEFNAFSFPEQAVAAERDYSMKLIGSPVIPRSWVALALTLFCSSLMIIAFWKSWVGKLIHVGLLAPVFAIVASGALWVATLGVRRDLDDQIGKFQLVQLAANGATAVVREQATVYQSNVSSMQLDSEVDARVKVDPSVSSGISRMVATDFHQSTLKNSNWPAGVWRYGSHFTLSTQDLVVQADLDPTGIQLTLPPGLPSQMADTVLVYAPGFPVICSPSANGFRTDGSLTAEGEGWFTDAVVSDEQQRRMEVYSSLFSPALRSGVLAGSLYGWTELWNEGPRWNRQLPTSGSALVALPVILRRPEPGVEVLVPHCLVRLRQVDNAAGMSTAFRESEGRWIDESMMAATLALQFVLPPETTPFAASSIDIELAIRAPQRRVRLAAMIDGVPLEITQLDSPAIPWRGRITEPEILRQLQTGTLEFRLEVGELAGGTEQSSAANNVVPWQVRRFQLATRGSVLPASNLATLNAANP